MAPKSRNADPDSESPSLTLGLFGAAGSLGQQVLIACEGEGIRIETLVPAGFSESLSTEVKYRGTSATVQKVDEVDIASLDAAIVAMPPLDAKPVLEALKSTGIFTIDVSGASDTDFPCVWPVQSYSDDMDMAGGTSIPGPIASTVAPVLRSLSAKGAIESVHVVALHSAASQGKDGPKRLSSQTLDLLNFRIPSAVENDGLLAFNVLPCATQFAQGARGRAQREIAQLTGFVGGEDITVQSLRVPVFAGLSCALRVRFKEALPVGDESKAESVAEIALRGPFAGLRESLDADSIHVSAIEQPDTRTITCVCFADPTVRTANAIGRLLHCFVQEGL